jgi:predicted nucleic acid-binding protein
MLIGLIKPSDTWHAWADAQFLILKQQGPLLLVDIVFAEWSIAMKDRHDVDTTIAVLGLQRFRCSDDALYRAGQAFREYKDNRKGQGKRVLPDMIIGAIAEIEDIPLVTANPGDFASYFPTVRLINP